MGCKTLLKKWYVHLLHPEDAFMDDFRIFDAGQKFVEIFNLILNQHKR